MFFNALSGSDARQLFEEFIEQWNNRNLPARYYKGISPAQARRSHHSWKIRGKLLGQASQSRCLYDFLTRKPVKVMLNIVDSCALFAFVQKCLESLNSLQLIAFMPE